MNRPQDQTSQMTLRDQFAIAALPVAARCLDMSYPQRKSICQMFGAIAETSYNLADAMIVARKNKRRP